MDGTKYRYLSSDDYHLYLSDELCAKKGYYLDEDHEPELLEKIREVENAYGGTVYAVIHNLLAFGECYSLLYISKYDEDQEFMFSSNTAYAYVWNKTDDWCSEFGTIGVKSALGGLVRTA
jgi:hypothetical protein